MRFKLRLSVLLAVVGGLLLPAAVGSLLIIDYQRQALSRNLAADHARLTEILALGIEGSLWNMSTEVGRPLVLSVLGDPRVVRVGVRDTRVGPFLAEERADRRRGQQFTLSRDVIHDGKTIGQVTVEIDSGESDIGLANARRLLVYTVLGQLLLSVLLIVGLLNARLLAPIRRLTRESDKLARRELNEPFVWRRDDELGSLGAGLERTRRCKGCSASSRRPTASCAPTSTSASRSKPSCSATASISKSASPSAPASCRWPRKRPRSQARPRPPSSPASAMSCARR